MTYFSFANSSSASFTTEAEGQASGLRVGTTAARRRRPFHGNDHKPPTSRWEAEVRSIVHASGLRYWVNKTLACGTRSNGQMNFCQPDLTFPRIRLAVFLDGCYWHGCPMHYADRASEREAKQVAGLADRKWSSLRIWEHDGPEAAADRIIAAYRVAA